mmetsp:Transcript_9163/g.6914  ORF Transcript_9163/g.6914 Transcript_9163/m.6914 type:complete len:151 (-) Transcript_9163:448-900(-)
MKGESIVGLFKVDFEALEVIEVKSKVLDYAFFGEGSTIFNNHIYTLTWKERVVLVHDLELNEVKRLTIPSQIREGWGIAHDKNSLWVTDSTQYYYQVDPDTFEILKKVTSKDMSGKDLKGLNEIEIVGEQYLYANQFLYDYVYRLDKTSG